MLILDTQKKHDSIWTERQFSIDSGSDVCSSELSDIEVSVSEEEEDTEPETSDGGDWKWGFTQGRHRSVHPFAWAPRDVKKWGPFFQQIQHSLQCADIFHCSYTPLCDMAINDMVLLSAVTVQTRHCMKQCGGELDCTCNRSTQDFHSNSVIHDWYFHIFLLLSFSDNNKELDMSDKNYDELWKVGTLSDILNDVC